MPATAFAHAEERPLHPRRRNCLVLNSTFEPLSTWPLSIIPPEEAVSAILRDRAYSVEDWPGEFFRSPSTSIAVPKVIALRHYAHVRGVAKFCRRSIALRDEMSCLYCLQEFPMHDLTFDHVVPRALGGQTTWENVVMACLDCNAKKAHRLDMKPARMPYRPTTGELLQKGLKYLPNHVREDYGSFLYWGAELLP